jgi:phosphonate transport system ATP-binding protein
MSSALPVFEMKHVGQRFGSLVALTEISFRIYPGERVALVGSSGAGKSTLLRLLNGTLVPTQGEVWAFGKPLKQLSSRRLRQVQRQIGTIYQQFYLVNNLAVVHNVNAGHLGRWPLWKAALSLLHPLEVTTAMKALQRVGIPDKLYARTETLSGGQQQRVALARVLVQNPLAIVADEPVASLDPELSREVIALLCDLAGEEGKTLVVSLHSADLARTYCDRMIGLQDGAICFDAPAAAVTSEMMQSLYQLRGWDGAHR